MFKIESKDTFFSNAVINVKRRESKYLCQSCHKEFYIDDDSGEKELFTPSTGFGFIPNYYSLSTSLPMILNSIKPSLFVLSVLFRASVSVSDAIKFAKYELS